MLYHLDQWVLRIVLFTLVASWPFDGVTFTGFSQWHPRISSFSLTLSSSQNNFNLGTWLSSQGWNGVTPVTITVTIPNGVVISSTSVATAAFVIPSLPPGSSVDIVNQGRIQGRGGNGGSGGSGCTSAGAAGGHGGDALSVGYPVTVNNSAGQIWAGGGGGGGGGGGADYSCSQPGSGGGGGSGTTAGASGTAGGCLTHPANPGEAGTASTGGAGGAAPAALCPSATGGGGGAGGGPGLSGAAGTAGFGPTGSGGGGPGGSPGRYAVGNSLISWTSIGDRRGGVLP